MKAVPQISKYMTVHPHTIGMNQSLSKAHSMMKEHNIRHLPVLDGSRLVGIISDRDIKSVMTFKDVNVDTIQVHEAVTENPFTVKPESQLDDVCAEMGAHKFGSALVVDNGKLVGIFTWVDALNALTELLGTRLKK